MKKLLVLPFLIAFILQACKKDAPKPDTEERNPEIIIKDIANKLSTADSISSFTNALKNLKLTEEETKDGLTIFAPLNDKPGENSFDFEKYKTVNTSGNQKLRVTASVPDSTLRDYIVRGIYKLSDLTNGKTFTALSGKLLTIFRNADIVKINDVVLNTKEVLESNNEIVFVIKSRLDTITAPDTIGVVRVPLTEETFRLALLEVENDINVFHKNLVLLDGILSHDAELDSLPAVYKNSFVFREISRFGFNSASSVIQQTWTNAYKIVNKLNYCEVNASDLLSNKNQKIATIKALRSYVYMQLLSYFGNIILVPKVPDVNYLYTNSDKTGVINFINRELDSASNVLPIVQTDTILLNRNIVRALQAKMALLQKDYQKTEQLTDAIINSSVYQLEPESTIFSNSSKEIIWNNSSNLNANIKAYFYNRPNLPYLRYTEIFLMNAEANLMLGNNPKAQQVFDKILLRSAKSGTVNINTLQQTWLSEMKREGNSFINLIRWNAATSLLGPKGFTAPKNNLLPIPESELQLLPSLIQNPGY